MEDISSLMHEQEQLECRGGSFVAQGETMEFAWKTSNLLVKRILCRPCTCSICLFVISRDITCLGIDGPKLPKWFLAGKLLGFVHGLFNLVPYK